MALEKSEWESKVSALPYYMGTWRDAECTGQLSPGIYVLHGCQQVSPEYLTDRGYQPLLTMVELMVRPHYRVDTTAAVWAETLKPHHSGPLVEAAAETFGQAPIRNRLYLTLPRAEADQLMTEWVQNSLSDRCERVGVVVRCSGPAGFVSIRRLSEEVEQIDLLGVRPQFRGHGWGKALAAWAVGTRRANCLKVRTERSNLAAIKTYMSAGFQPISSDELYWAKVEC